MNILFVANRQEDVEKMFADAQRNINSNGATVFLSSKMITFPEGRAWFKRVRNSDDYMALADMRLDLIVPHHFFNPPAGFWDFMRARLRPPAPLPNLAELSGKN